MNLIDLTIIPKERVFGNFTSFRLLPSAQRQMVGPFISLDHIGPAHFHKGQGLDVRPHPHIGIATVTYLFDGTLFHRDSLGSAREILPGNVNWMTAGRGIAHSERTGMAHRVHAHDIHGIQLWIALPKEYEEIAPSFHHYDSHILPEFILNTVSLKLIAGKAFGYNSPVEIHSPLFYAEVKMPAFTRLVLPADYPERALYLIKGRVKIGNTIIHPKSMPIFNRDDTIIIESEHPSHLILLGGYPFSERRYVWWNFVSSSLDRIEQAKDDWQSGKFAKIPGDDIEFIPMPEK